MDIPIPEFSREQIPRFPHEKELRSMAAMGMPVPFTRGEKTILTGLSAIREAIEAQKNEPEKVEPEKVYFTLEEAAEYLRLTDRQLKDLCRDKNISHARFDYRTYRFRKSDLDEWFAAYRHKRKSVYD